MTLSIACLACTATASESSVNVQPTESSNLVSDVWFKARLRNEHVDQDNNLDEAHAATLKSVVGLKTRELGGFSALVEAENIFALVDDYNSTTNGETGHSVVADPEDTELNRVQITYTGIADTTVTLGRQRMVLDNARFIGNVGWRQNEQTFDAVRVDNTSLANTTLTVAYINKVRRIFGPDSPNGTTDMRTPIVNVRYNGFENMKLTGYAYFLDNEDQPGTSQRTIGLRFDGTQQVAGLELDYLLEWADQSDYKSGATNIDASYLHLRTGTDFDVVRLAVGQERLHGDGDYAFQTPLATAHAFNGWTDQFLNTPADGLLDTYVEATRSFGNLKLKAVLHRFEADDGGADYGDEINLLATYKFNDQFSAGLKLAHYNADNLGVDTQKYWLYGQFSY